MWKQNSQNDLEFRKKKTLEPHFTGSTLTNILCSLVKATAANDLLSSFMKHNQTGGTP